MRYVYGIEVLERNPATDKMEPCFVKPFPDIPLQDYEITTRAELEETIRSCEFKWWHRDAIIAGIWFTLDQCFPKHAYRITKVPWKYD
jgi:hypothetical protein